MRSSWIIWVSLKSNDKCPSKSKAKGGVTQREDTEGRPCVEEGRDQGHAARGHHELEGARESSPGESLEGVWPC